MGIPCVSHLIILSLLIFIIIKIVLYTKSKSSDLLPPGPSGWPVFGHMFSLGSTPHRAIAELAPNYGPVVWLRLGSINTMAVLNAKAATELFKNHDLSFADRSTVEVMTSHGYHEASLVMGPYGQRWRELRRISTVELFVNKRVNETVGIRQKCVENMLSWIEKERVEDPTGMRGVHIGRYVFLASFNIFGNLMFSKDLVGPESETGAELFNAIRAMTLLASKPNLSDVFPLLRWIDPQGLKRKSDHNVGVAIGIVSALVKERMQQQNKGEEIGKGFLDVLLKDHESGKISEKEMVIFILEIFMAGAETTSTTIEWAMTELLRHPDVMAKAKHEISGLIGSNKKLEEHDLKSLPYLNVVIKETLRLRPPAPLLVPRRAVHDTHFMNYFIPKGTQVFVNVWAIGRDPECWDDPLSFNPERFLGTSVHIDYKGQNFEFIPFGAGRRMCAGLPMGDRMLHFFLATLLHEFDWKPESSVTPDTLDTRERMGTAMSKFEPLKAVPMK